MTFPVISKKHMNFCKSIGSIYDFLPNGTIDNSLAALNLLSGGQEMEHLLQREQYSPGIALDEHGPIIAL